MKRIRAYLHVVWASVLLAAACAPASAATSRIFDCPLRDARFSIDSPLVDLLLSDSAKAVIDFMVIPGEDLQPTARTPQRTASAESFAILVVHLVGFYSQGVALARLAS